jgi:hypothetical protein
MIRIKLTILLICIYRLTAAQTNTFPTNGNVGIGTTNPSSKLDVIVPASSGLESLAKFKVEDAPNDFLEFSNLTGSNSQFIPLIRAKHITANRTALYISGEIENANDAGLEPVVVFDSRISSSAVSFRPLFQWTSYTTKYMTMLANGNLGIGTTSPTAKLSVNGKIHAKEIKVDLNIPGPDYVFDENYKLLSLTEVQKFVKENKHLPEIPSAKDMEENGLNLSDMNMLLLKKIEELTLHLISLNEEVSQLKEKYK